MVAPIKTIAKPIYAELIRNIQKISLVLCQGVLPIARGGLTKQKKYNTSTLLKHRQEILEFFLHMPLTFHKPESCDLTINR